MSAYLVSIHHIRALVNAGLATPANGWGPLSWSAGAGSNVRMTLTPETAERTGAMLLAENMRSVNYRYDEDEIETVYTHGPSSRRSPTEILKAIACYEYQTCESVDWAETEAHDFCRQLRIEMIHSLLGYADIPWGIDEP
ncbi:hypothetical protein H490_0101650 [Leucobacter sp. UCD-THU]|uniref:hypothetical protein n=1 Tax=Leucobacter sp. UCD-THU TaxID=1292023 RepID=UPI00045F6F4C|nr:hypothetical protein [Leucobacter sp. UCD-THU]EYT56589.1 hypothetical protein H490_0101650 [Leucobacter sp. UCD-THU]